MAATHVFDGFDLVELCELRDGVQRLRDAAIRTTGSADAKMKAADRIAGYNKVLAELTARIATKKAS